MRSAWYLHSQVASSPGISPLHTIILPQNESVAERFFYGGFILKGDEGKFILLRSQHMRQLRHCLSILFFGHRLLGSHISIVRTFLDTSSTLPTAPKSLSMLS